MLTDLNCYKPVMEIVCYCVEFVQSFIQYRSKPSYTDTTFFRVSMKLIFIIHMKFTLFCMIHFDDLHLTQKDVCFIDLSSLIIFDISV